MEREASAEVGMKRKRPWNLVRQEHKAYFAVLAVLFQPVACQEASPEMLDARRDILRRLKKELHIPDSVSDAVHGALKSDKPLQWQRSLVALQGKVKAKLPEHAPLMLGNLELCVGADVDVKDFQKNWLPGKINGLQGSSLCIHYHGWANKWDEWVDVSHGRVAPRETYTSKAAWGRRKHNGKQRL
ncbi:unnamed protein product [Ectocarpus sp. 8 AP-2014]